MLLLYFFLLARKGKGRENGGGEMKAEESFFFFFKVERERMNEVRGKRRGVREGKVEVESQKGPSQRKEEVFILLKPIAIKFFLLYWK